MGRAPATAAGAAPKKAAAAAPAAVAAPVAVAAASPAAKKAKPAKAAGGAAGPKRPLSGYMHFAAHYREVLKREAPTLAQKEIIQAIGHKWNTMTVVEKKPFEERAAADKARYAAEGGKMKSVKTGSGKTNGYALFLKEMRPVVLKRHPGISFADVGRKVAELWKGIAESEKDKYKAKARAA